MSTAEVVGTWCRSQLSALKGGERGVLKAPGLDQEEGQLFSYSVLHKTNHKRVSSPSKTPLVLGQATGNTDSLDSPRTGFGGSHHLPPYCRNPTLAKCGGEAQHLEKVRIWSPPGLPNVQSSTARPKTPRIRVFLVSLKRY